MATIDIRALVPRSVTESDVNEINKLLVLLSPGADTLSLERIQQIAEYSRFVVARYRGQAIVGMATLIPIRKPTGFVGHIEDVVVLEAFRELGIGRKLIEYLIRDARSLRLKYIDLTSRSHRVEAHALYLSLEFMPRDTTCFRLEL